MNTDLDMHVAQTSVSRGPTPSQHAFVENHHVFLSSFVSCSCYRVYSNTLKLSDKNHQPQFIPRCIDAHAIQKDGSSEEQLAMNDDDHQNLICNFGNPQENRNHHQQNLGSIDVFSGTVTDGYVAYHHPK